MQFSELTTLLHGTLLTNPSHEISELNFCGAADLMDEIKRQYAKGSVLVTGLTTGGVIQTAIEYDLAVVVMVRGKKPAQEELKQAQAIGLPVRDDPAHPVYHLRSALFQWLAWVGRLLVI